MIQDLNLAALREVFIKHGVILAYLFGSQAEGRARSSSDVDIAVLLPPEAGEADQLDIQLKLAGELSSVLGRNDLDLVVLNEASPLLAHEIVNNGRVLFEDPATKPAVDFAVYTAARYADSEHFRRLSREYMRERMERQRAATGVEQ
jgi:predicted nucleotidyltransferase